MAYEINYDDKRFQEVESDRKEALTEAEQLYGGMANEAEKYYQAQIDASKEWEATQKANQQAQTDFAIEQIEQQKDKAERDYTKEQYNANLAEEQRQYNASLAEQQRQHNETLAYQKAKAASSSSSSGSSGSGYTNTSTAAQAKVEKQQEEVKAAAKTYESSVKILQSAGATSGDGGLMTKSEWTSRKSNGSKAAEVKYDDYEEYLGEYVTYKLANPDKTTTVKNSSTGKTVVKKNNRVTTIK